MNRMKSTQFLNIHAPMLLIIDVLIYINATSLILNYRQKMKKHAKLALPRGPLFISVHRKYNTTCLTCSKESIMCFLLLSQY